MILEQSELDDLLSVPYRYVQRPRPVAGDGRPVWRVPYVVMLVSACRAKRATPQQLHVLNWAIRTSSSAERFSKFLGGQSELRDAVVRFEPALDRAIALAGALELIHFDAGKWALSDDGSSLVSSVYEDADLLCDLKNKLEIVGTPVTQVAVSNLLGRGGRL